MISKDELLSIMDILPEYAKELVSEYLNNDPRELSTIIAYAVYDFYLRVENVRMDKGVETTKRVVNCVKNMKEKEPDNLVAGIESNRLLDALNEPQTIYSLEKITNMSSSTLRRKLNDLIKEGRVIKIEEGAKGSGNATLYAIAEGRK
jgi:predicted transcriptional regulator